MGDEKHPGPAVRRLGTWLAWWVVLMATWVIVDESVSRDELIAGAVAAAGSAALAEIVGNQARVRFQLRMGWLAAAVRLPAQVTRDTAVVFAALWRRISSGQQPCGGFVAEPVRPGADSDLGRARRALLVGVQSLAPNKFALGVDRERGVMIAHKLVLTPRDRPQ